MDEENSILNGKNEETPLDETPGENGAELENELEELKDTFQTVLNETTQQAEQQPVIQELDYHGEEPADEPAEAVEEKVTEPAKAKKKSKDGKKKVPIAAVIIPVVLCVLIIIPLLAYFILNVTIPDFNSFLTAYSTASASETAAEKVTNYEAALEYCDEDSKLAGLRQDILEKIVVAMCESEGYGSAYSYMTENMDEDMIASPSSKDFKTFLETESVLKEIAAKVFDAANEAVGEKTDDSDVDYAALADSLGATSLIKEDVTNVLKYIGAGIVGENAAEDKEDIQDAVSSYFNAYSLLDEIGAETTDILEKITIKLYDYGYAYEAQLVIDNYMDEEDVSASTNENFTAVAQELEGLKEVDCDVYAIALQQYNAGKYGEDDIKALIPSDGLSEKQVDALVQLVLTATEALAAENEEKNLTKASTDLSTLVGALDTFEMSVEDAALEAIKVYLLLADTQTANSVKENYLADSTVTSDILTELDALYNAQYAANEAFYPYYYNYAYYGSTLDKTEIIAALDALITSESNEYDKAFVEYYKYLAEAFTDADDNTMLGYLESFAKSLSEYPLAYGYAYGQLCLDMGNDEKALEIANEMLKVNVADDFANSVLARNKRVSGDVDGALEIAKNGAELSGTVDYCAYEETIAYLLKGEYAEAFKLAKELYENNLTTNNCELVKIINALFTDADEATKTELTELSDEIDETFSTYSVTLSDDAQGIIDGTLTLEDVFLKDDYDLG